jgi:hypothetical protein
MGALTQGDRRAATGASNMKDFNLDTKWGQQALEQMLAVLSRHTVIDTKRLSSCMFVFKSSYLKFCYRKRYGSAIWSNSLSRGRSRGDTELSYTAVHDGKICPRGFARPRQLRMVVFFLH